MAHAPQCIGSVRSSICKRDYSSRSRSPESGSRSHTRTASLAPSQATACTTADLSANGTIQDGYVVCPWHHWMFHRLTGEARPGIPAAVPRYELKVEAGDLLINLVPVTSAKTRPAPGTSTQPRDRPRSRTAARGGNFDDRHGQRVSAVLDLRRVVNSRPSITQPQVTAPKPD